MAIFNRKKDEGNKAGNKASTESNKASTESKYKLSKNSIALLTSLIAISNMAQPVLAMNTKDVYIDNDRKSTGTEVTIIDRHTYQRNNVLNNYGQITIAQTLESIIEDARGTCLGSARCVMALPINDLYENSERYNTLGLETAGMGTYAIAISGDSNKARMLAIVENKYDTTYNFDTINKFIETKKNEMKRLGLYREAEIASNAIVKNVGNFVVVAMNPHAEESMKVIEEGLGYLPK